MCRLSAPQRAIRERAVDQGGAATARAERRAETQRGQDQDGQAWGHPVLQRTVKGPGETRMTPLSMAPARRACATPGHRASIGMRWRSAPPSRPRSPLIRAEMVSAELAPRPARRATRAAPRATRAYVECHEVCSDPYSGGACHEAGREKCDAGSVCVPMADRAAPTRSSPLADRSKRPVVVPPVAPAARARIATMPRNTRAARRAGRSSRSATGSAARSKPARSRRPCPRAAASWSMARSSSRSTQTSAPVVRRVSPCSAVGSAPTTNRHQPFPAA